MPDGRYLPRESRREPLWERIDRLQWTVGIYAVVFVAVSALSLSAILGTAVVLAWGMLGGLRASYADGFMQSFGQMVPRVYLAVLLGGLASSGAWAAYAFLRSERWLLRRLGAVRVPQGEMLDTKMALKDMAIAAGLPVAPELYLLESTNVNAFVFAAAHRRPVLGITQGLVERLPIAQQRAVFASLVARLVTGDIASAAALASLVGPISAWRERGLDGDQDESFVFDEDGVVRSEFAGPAESLAALAPLFMVFGFGLIVLTEMIAAGHRSAQLRAAEKGDARGMLLLKEPLAMLAALEAAVRLDNYVAGAGPGLGDLFFCWTGSESTDDEDDPEWQRVSRLREVLGVEGVDLHEHLAAAEMPA